jgi:omega-amidase
VIPATLYNTAVVIGPSGDILGTYRKIHIAGEEKHYFRPGDRIPVFDTPVGRIGIAICYDTFFPEMTRILALKGAEILCFPYNAWSGVENKDVVKHLSVARAAESRVFVVASNRVGEDVGRVFFGGSAIAGPRGGLFAQAGEDEEVLIATFHREDFVKERAMVPVFADRRPELYADVIGEPILSVTQGSAIDVPGTTQDGALYEEKPGGVQPSAHDRGL